VQNGYAITYESAAAFEADAPGREIQAARGVRIDVIKGSDIHAFDPALSTALTHLVLLPEQGHCPNPLRLSRGLAARLRQGGAQFATRSVTGFDLVDGRVARVRTDHDTLEADAIVIAAGAHSGELSAQLGGAVPLETERGYHAMVASPGAAPRMPVASGEGKYFVTPMEEGVRIAGTVELAGLAAPPDYRRADALLHKAQRLLPGLRGANAERWMGHRPSLPDSMPVIGRAPHAINAWFAFGHGHVGLTGAAPTGEIIADLIDERPPFIDIAPFRAERFR
jgi:D-amino-acid dehydrogenase